MKKKCRSKVVTTVLHGFGPRVGLRDHGWTINTSAIIVLCNVVDDDDFIFYFDGNFNHQYQKSIVFPLNFAHCCRNARQICNENNSQFYTLCHFFFCCFWIVHNSKSCTLYDVFRLVCITICGPISLENWHVNAKS